MTSISRGEIYSAATAYSTTAGGANHLARSIDPSQYAAAVHMIKVATDNMKGQFSPYLTVFQALA